jgi:hypothetical protein
LVPRLRELVDACLAHHGATGNRRGYTDWYRAAQHWITNDVKFRRERREEEYPQEQGPRMSEETGEDFVPIGNVLSIVDSIAGGRK